MTPAQFRAAGRMLYVSYTADGFGASGLAELLNVSLRTVQRWGIGETEIPQGVEEEVLDAVKAAMLRRQVPAAQVIHAALNGELTTTD